MIGIKTKARMDNPTNLYTMNALKRQKEANAARV
jgi:hypothetical protein